MAVVKMNKFTILTLGTFKEQLLKQLQIFESVHFKDLQTSENDLSELDYLKKDSARESALKCENELLKIKFVLDKIKPYVDIPKGFKAMTTKVDVMTFEKFDKFSASYNYEPTFQNVKIIDEKLKAIKAEKNKLKADNEALKCWLNMDVSTAQLDKLKQIVYFVGTINKVLPEEFVHEIDAQYPSSYVEVFGTIKDETTLLCVFPVELEEEAFAFLKTKAFTKSSVDLKKVPYEKIAENELKVNQLDEQEILLISELSTFATEYKQLLLVQDCYKTELERAKVCENFLSLENVVIISGWVAESEFADLEQIVAKCCKSEFYIEKEEVERDSVEVPIKLKNNKVIGVFEGITSMYALPRYNEIDPTPLFAPFYMLFFGLMVGDIGYGIILMIISFVTMKFLNVGIGVKNFMKFLFVLSFFVIGAGIIYGGAFGIAVFTPLPLMKDGVQVLVKGVPQFKAILDSGHDIVIMIILSVAIGVVHVLLGVLIKGYALIKEGKYADALFDSGFWFLCVLSGIGFLLGGISTGGVPLLPPFLGQLSKWTFFAMIIALTATQGRENKSFGTKLAGGLFGVYGLTSYVGDIVSYTRIVALALSGAYIAMSFNRMASLMPNIFTQVLFGALIFIFGQTLNLGLAVLGAYVHTCRLQYVEYFGKFYEGGGKPFKAFKLMNESIIVSGKNK